LSVDALALMEPAGALGTPESKPTMGILRRTASCSWSSTALVSRAARAIAAGFLERAFWSILTCSWMSASEGGPSNVISTPYCAAAASEPALTVCQNWCCRPLDTTGM
jgi:hypothetical protein